MEIQGVGAEIVECLRIGRMIENHGEAFLRRVYTEREILHCQSRRRALEHFAAHWAGKESVLKSLGAAGQKNVVWTDLEIRDDMAGQAQVSLTGSVKEMAQQIGVVKFLLSLSHCRAYATAYALAVRA
jgi:holo-[acyl-carrier protein] synthase